MEPLLEKVSKLIIKKEYPWILKGRSIIVELTQQGRKQRIKLNKQGETYVFSSIIINSNAIRGKKRRRRLAYRAWRKNGIKDLVSFSFNDKGDLVGVIEQPVQTLDHEELSLYIETLAMECDRFEYILTGDDNL